MASQQIVSTVLMRPLHPGRIDTALHLAAYLLLALLLLTPLVISPGTFSHFVVSKAIYSRMLTEVLVLVWLILALRNPEYRPHFSWVLLAFAMYVVVALLASVSGINPSHSFWSDYGLMTGVWDQIHWFLLLLVSVSLVKSQHQWKLLLHGQLLVALVLSLIALSQAAGFSVLPSVIPKCRVDATLGNPTFLAPFLVISILIAAGLIVRSLLTVTRDADPDANSEVPRGQDALGHRYASWIYVVLRLFWTAVIALGILALIQTGTRGALIGLAAGALAIPVAMLIWGNRSAIRPAALTFAGVLIAVSTFMAIDRISGFPLISGCSDQSAAARFNSLAEATSLTEATTDDLSLATRVMSIKTGSLGFLDRPALGWGPENFGYAFDRYVDGWIFKHGSYTQDKAHNQVMEELTTKGLVGLASFVFLWGTIVWAVVHRRRTLKSELLTYTILGALAGYFTQNLFLFDTPATAIYWVFLVAWVAAQENEITSGQPGAYPAHSPLGRSMPSNRLVGLVSRPLHRLACLARINPKLQVLAVVLMLPLLGLSLFYLNYQPYAGARWIGQSTMPGLELSERLALSEKGIEAFPAMANLPRRLAILQLTRHWQTLSPEEQQIARGFAGRQAALALQADFNDAPFLITTVLFSQTSAQSAQTLDSLEPMLMKLTQIAPERVETHQLLANQAFQRTDYSGALMIAEEFEAKAPGTERFFSGLKAVARQRLDGSVD